MNRLASVAVVLAASALLAACTTPAPNPSSSPSGAASGGATPSPTPTGLPADVAFVVTGTLTSPSGAAAFDFAMTVKLPSTATAADDAAAFAASAHCPPGMLTPTTATSPAYVHVEVVTTGDSVPDEVGIRGMDGYPATWDGDYLTAQAYCAPPILTPVPGTATAIGLVQDGVDEGTDGWIPSSGGYGVTAYAVDPATMDATPYSVTACAIEFGPSPGAAAAFIRVNPTDGCQYGLR